MNNSETNKFKNNKTLWLDLWTCEVIAGSGSAYEKPASTSNSNSNSSTISTANSNADSNADSTANSNANMRVLTREAIENYQLDRLNRIFKYTRNNSDFYRNLYREFDSDFRFESLEQLALLPLISPDDLLRHEREMLCVSQREISRVVTLLELETSGTSGEPKHIYFTPDDQELSIAHFKYGMQYLIDSDGKVLIMLPHERPGSVGDLLAKAVKRLGAEVTFDIETPDITCIAGLPSQIAALAEKSKNMPPIKSTRPDKYKAGEQDINMPQAGHEKYTSRADELRNTLDSVLLTAEYVSQENIDIITKTWNCLPFEHYGMTEMGLGGAVTCNHFCGYHPREHDLLFEIIDPDTCEVLPDGEYGEIVFTTLTRKGMPFIRYRTGDISRFIPEPCPCGSVLKRLERVGDRRMKKGWNR